MNKERKNNKNRRKKDNKSLNHLTAEHTPANNIKGIGDICRYMGVVDGVTWHTPTAADFAELYGSTLQDKGQAKRLGAFVIGSFTPLSGAAFGPNHNDVTLTADNRVTNADPYINGAVFVPSSGYRHPDTGAVSSIGSWGYSWSSTASTSANAHYLQLNSTNIWPQRNDRRSHGFPVRCIRD